MKLRGIAIGAAISLTLMNAPIAGTEDRTYERQRLELVQKTESILIENKVCESKPDCQRKKLFFIGPAESGIRIEIYGVNSDSALRQIIAECANYFVESGAKMRIGIKVFGITKDEDLDAHFWQIKKPLMTVQFKGDQ
jgi:hypothetical protein